MSSGETKTVIIKHFVARCQRSTHKPLGFLDVDEDVYVGPTEPAEVVNELTATFSNEDCLESGLLVMEESGRVTLVPALTGGASFVVLRDGVTGQPYDLLTSAGCLAGDALPAFEILRDRRTQHFIKERTGDLLVAYDLQDVIMLRACGLAATLSVGLDDLPLESLDLFCQSFGLTRDRSYHAVFRELYSKDFGSPAENRSDDRAGGPSGIRQQDAETDASPTATKQTATKQATLIFLAWTPSTFSAAVPAPLQPIVDRLQDFERFLGVELDEIYQWEMNIAALKRLQFIADESISAHFFKEALLDEVDKVNTIITELGQEKPIATGPPSDFPTAMTELQEIDSSQGRLSSYAKEQLHKKRRHAERLLNRQVVEPLRHFALETHHPLQRTLLMGCAQFSQLFHLQSIALHAQICRNSHKTGSQIPQGQLESLMATSDRLLGMTKEAQKFPQPALTIIHPSPLESTSSPRLTHSD